MRWSIFAKHACGEKLNDQKVLFLAESLLQSKQFRLILYISPLRRLSAGLSS